MFSRTQGWRDEMYAVSSSFHATPLFSVERAAAPVLGIVSYGVHSCVRCCAASRSRSRIVDAPFAATRSQCVCARCIRTALAHVDRAAITVATDVARNARPGAAAPINSWHDHVCSPPVSPGTQCAAGGIPSVTQDPFGASPTRIRDNAKRELLEEAAVPADLADHVRFVDSQRGVTARHTVAHSGNVIVQIKAAGCISYFHTTARGYSPEVRRVSSHVRVLSEAHRVQAEFIFDLEVPESFQPVVSDGEVECFQKFTISEVSAAVVCLAALC
jgi:hypothetical protein